MRIIIYKILIFTFIVSFNVSNALCQGGWFIRYLSIDSLKYSSIIGKEIRIDFKSSVNDISSGNVEPLYIRNLLRCKDTVSLSINGRLVKFSEDWKLYLDLGTLKEQSLKSTNSKATLRVREMFLESVNDLSLTIIAFVYDSSGQMIRERISVRKSLIKGILMRR